MELVWLGHEMEFLETRLANIRKIRKISLVFYAMQSWSGKRVATEEESPQQTLHSGALIIESTARRTVLNKYSLHTNQMVYDNLFKLLNRDFFYR